MESLTRKSGTRTPVRADPEELCIELLYLAGDIKALSPEAAELVALAAGQLEADLRRSAAGRMPVQTLSRANGKSHRHHADA